MVVGQARGCYGGVTECAVWPGQLELSLGGGAGSSQGAPLTRPPVPQVKVQVAPRGWSLRGRGGGRRQCPECKERDAAQANRGGLRPAATRSVRRRDTQRQSPRGRRGPTVIRPPGAGVARARGETETANGARGRTEALGIASRHSAVSGCGCWAGHGPKAHGPPATPHSASLCGRRGGGGTRPDVPVPQFSPCLILPNSPILPTLWALSPTLELLFGPRRCRRAPGEGPLHLMATPRPPKCKPPPPPPEGANHFEMGRD